jgi:acetoin utilization protein AcuB
MNDAISNFMTHSPHTIGIGVSLAEARERMNEYGVRHLPVLEAGTLVGLLSQRDIQLLETFKDVNLKQVQVEEAMSQDVLSVAPSTPVTEVARRMAERKYGSTVVVQGGHVLGIFTTIDALNALIALHPKGGPARATRELPIASKRERGARRPPKRQ